MPMAVRGPTKVAETTKKGSFSVPQVRAELSSENSSVAATDRLGRRVVNACVPWLRVQACVGVSNALSGIRAVSCAQVEKLLLAGDVVGVRY